MMPSTTFNLLGFPALTVPFLVNKDGLPVGVQLVGRPWEEERLLDLGVMLEAARGAVGEPPED
jgi:aspartyl-tRNA(Asn)/glutamyl-tRNA(Gln) amidotransferase subunit A